MRKGLGGEAERRPALARSEPEQPAERTLVHPAVRAGPEPACRAHCPWRRAGRREAGADRVQGPAPGLQRRAPRGVGLVRGDPASGRGVAPAHRHPGVADALLRPRAGRDGYPGRRGDLPEVPSVPRGRVLPPDVGEAELDRLLARGPGPVIRLGDDDGGLLARSLGLSGREGQREGKSRACEKQEWGTHGNVSSGGRREGASTKPAAAHCSVPRRQGVACRMRYL